MLENAVCAKNTVSLGEGGEAVGVWYAKKQGILSPSPTLANYFAMTLAMLLDMRL